MYSLDTNINTAIERQADRIHTVRAFRSAEAFQQSAPDGADSQGRPSAKLTVALAAAAPIVALLAWVLVAR